MKYVIEINSYHLLFIETNTCKNHKRHYQLYHLIKMGKNIDLIEWKNIEFLYHLVFADVFKSEF